MDILPVTGKPEAMTGPFARLPTELVGLVANLLGRPDQANLAKTSSVFHRIVNPMIYVANIKHDNSTSLYWGAEHGLLGTLEHALASGADLNVLLKSDKDAFDSDDHTQGDDPVSIDGSVDNGDDAATEADKKRKPCSTALHVAAKNGHRHVAAWLLDHGADINARSWKYCDCLRMHWRRYYPRPTRPWWRPLYAALNHDHTSVAELLIFRGAQIDNLNTDATKKITALQVAAANGHVSIVKLLALDVSNDMNERDFRDNTALHYASQFWGVVDEDLFATSAIPKLLALGADIEFQNVDGHTPLMHACWMGNWRAAVILLKAGAQPDPHAFNPDFTDVRPLYYCCLSRAKIAQLCGRVPRQGVDEWEDSRIELLRALIEAGADIEARIDKNGRRGGTPLMFAAAFAGCRAVQILLEAGADVNAQDMRGETALLAWMKEAEIPAEDECPMIVSLLVEHGARFDLFDQDGMDALQYAISRYVNPTEDSNSKRLALKVMLDKADRRNISLHRLQLAMQSLCLSGLWPQLGLVILCTLRLYEITHEEMRVCFDNMLMQREPINQRMTFHMLMDTRIRNDTNERILLRVIRQRNKELALAILERGVAVSDTGAIGGKSFLHPACHWGDLEVVSALLERAAEVNVFDNKLQTPLMIAVINNNRDVARALMREVADPFLLPPDSLLEDLYPDDEDEDERRFIKRTFATAFDLAINHERYDILCDMLSSFALPEIPRRARNSYLWRACNCVHEDERIVELLLSKGADPNGGPDCLDPPLTALLRYMRDPSEDPEMVTDKLPLARLFARYGADANLYDGRGETAGTILHQLLFPARWGTPTPRQLKLAPFVARDLELVRDGDIVAIKTDDLPRTPFAAPKVMKTPVK